MKKSIKMLLAATLLIIMCMSFFPAISYADYSATAEIPVTVSRSGGVPDDVTYKIVLAAEEGSPEPDLSTLDYYDNLHGSYYIDTAEFNIKFYAPGIYYYTMYQDISEPYDHMTYDQTVYDVEIYVLNGENNSLYTLINITKQGDETKEKIADPSFNNYYDPNYGIKHLKVAKEWIDSNYSGRPSSVVVELYKNGESVESLLLSKENNWKGEFNTELNYDGTNKYEVKETTKHSRYVVRYNYNFSEDKLTLNCTVVNTLTSNGLIQTGQLNWPIYALAGLGIVAIAIGVFTTKRKKDNNA
jgi:LPXTG-motif cell wall-anchored protein